MVSQNAWQTYTRKYYAPRRIVIDGNIGSGKSTLLRGLQESLAHAEMQTATWLDLGAHVLALVVLACLWYARTSHTEELVITCAVLGVISYARSCVPMLSASSKYAFSQEDVSRWIADGLLGAQYKSYDTLQVRSSYAVVFQLLGPFLDFLKRSATFARLPPGTIWVQERCAKSALNVFVRASTLETYQGTSLTRLHAQRVQETYERCLALHPEDVALRLCVKTDASLCYDRLRQRSRSEELTLTREDLEALQTLYASFWSAVETSGEERIVTLDGDQDPECVLRQALRAIRSL